MTRLRGFLADDSGVSSVEYALLMAFVGGGIILGGAALTDAVAGQINDSAECVGNSVC